MKPLFYATNEVTLDAKGFEFKQLSFAGKSDNLKYQYDGQQVKIDLGKTFTRKDTFELFFDYVATPEQSGGSDAITSDKGLFFINADGTEDKPQQIWTQGETENNSRWFPTFDKPNERCTQEIYITVQDKYKTLSNGLLTKSTKNADGTRTDYWKMDQPHAPYLFMLAVGDFAVVQDRWKDIPLEYYVEPKVPRTGQRDIFSSYPLKMLGVLFRIKLGCKNIHGKKYSQVVVRDYVSGAMENTSAVVFGEFMQGDKDFLMDNLTNEKVVAHEMFHHWFGDYVTCESWANLTMNEGFANYSEYLWLEHKYGKDDADYHWLQELRGYLGQGETLPLIRYGYGDKEEMFDAHSYNKGGMVLHMLRQLVGDEAFFAALNLYLTRNAYTEVEADELRLAFEDITGRDLIWFFDQWYFNAGHPVLDITYGYDAASKMVSVAVEQQQKGDQIPPIFQIPTTIDIYLGEGKKISKEVLVNQRKQFFEFEVPNAPKLVNFNSDKKLLAVVEENKSDEEYVFQYYNAPTYLDRYEALQALGESESPLASSVFQAALDDKFYGLRELAVYQVNINNETIQKKAIYLAENDPKAAVRRAALEQLSSVEGEDFSALFERVIKNDVAASVKTAARLAVSDRYAATDNLQYLTFFEENWDKVDNYDAIAFFRNYAALAAKGDVTQIQSSADKLKVIAVKESSIWKRFSAMNAIFGMHTLLAQQMEEDATKATTFKALDDNLLQMIQDIKSQEKDSQLQQVYNARFN
ncbi:MAG: M1 family metallopeptidase [Saprospiraceae bacterium]|nr:M1 family metallopeptidase [Saprospiraceae bacterium]